MEGYGNPSEGDYGFSLRQHSPEMVGIVREDPAVVDVLDIERRKISGTAYPYQASADGIYPAVCRLSVRWDPGWRGCLYQYRQ